MVSDFEAIKYHGPLKPDFVIAVGFCLGVIEPTGDPVLANCFSGKTR